MRAFYNVMSLVLFVLEFNVNYSINNKQIIWQDFHDFCYFDKVRVQQQTNCVARCQQIPNVLVEKRYYDHQYHWCIVVERHDQRNYNITIDDEYKKNHYHKPVELGPELHERVRLIKTIINRNLYDPQHLLDLDANFTNCNKFKFNRVENTYKSTFLENSLIEIFDNAGITCDDIQKSMLNNHFLKLEKWSIFKISFVTKRKADIKRSFTIVYEMENNVTCPLLVNITTLPNTNIAEMIIYQGPLVDLASHPSQTKNLHIQSPISVKINGSEACDSFLARTPDPTVDNQRNINPLKYYDACRKVNMVRAEPEPSYCENLPEVNVRWLILNGESGFWCVTVNKTLAPSKYENDSRPIIVEIDVGAQHHFIRWYNKSNTIKNNTDTVFVFEVDYQILMSIEPKRESSEVSIIKSLKVNEVESCGLLLQNSVCGVRKIKHRSFIAYGLPTYPGQYPWHVAIYEIIHLSEKRYLCGGSIIGKNAVLTAAHCVIRNTRQLSPVNLVFEVGRFDLQYESKYTKEYDVIKVIPHAEYDVEYFENDIAILKSKLYIEFNDFVQPICLTSNAEHFENGVGYVPGWGKNELEQRENILSEASLPIVSNNVCRTSKRDFFQAFLTDGKFCGGYRNGTTVCSGDSGGGLVVEFPTRWFIKGIVSIGYSENGLCDANEYVLFTDVVYYNNWILSNVLN